MRYILVFIITTSFKFCYSQNLFSNDSLRFINIITLLSDSINKNNNVELVDNSIKLIFFTSDVSLSQDKKIDLLILISFTNQNVYNSICNKVTTDSLVRVQFNKINKNIVLPLCNCRHRNEILPKIMKQLENNSFRIDSMIINDENNFLLNGIARKIKLYSLENAKHISFIDYSEYVFALNSYYNKMYPLIWRY